MPQFAAPRIETGDCSILRRLRKRNKFGAYGHDIGDMLSVIGPVGRNMKHAPRAQFSGYQTREVALHNAPFVVPFFMPWVGEKQVYAVEAAIINR